MGRAPGRRLRRSPATGSRARTAPPSASSTSSPARCRRAREADALDASAQANRALQVRSLEQVDREPVEAEGATSAFRTEATYELPDGSPARSLEQSTVGEDGTYVLVRYSAGEQDYAEDLATAVLDSISVGGAEA